MASSRGAPGGPGDFVMKCGSLAAIDHAFVLQTVSPHERIDELEKKKLVILKKRPRKHQLATSALPVLHSSWFSWRDLLNACDLAGDSRPEGNCRPRWRSAHVRST